MCSREASSFLDASKNSRHGKGVEGEVDKPTEDHTELSGCDGIPGMKMRLSVKEMEGVKSACNNTRK